MSYVTVGTPTGFYTSNLWVKSIGSGDNAHFENLQSTNNEFLGGVLPGREVDTYSNLSLTQSGITYSYSGLFTVTVDRGILSLSGSASASGYYNHIEVTSGTGTIASYDGVPIPVDFGSQATGIVPDTVNGVLNLVNGLLFGSSSPTQYNYQNLTLGATPNLPEIAFSDGVEIHGNSGADILVGSSKSDVIDGGSGNDVIIGGGGSNILNGGTGEDTAVLDFKLGDAKLTYDTDDHVVLSGPNGAHNVLSGFEQYQFADALVNAENLDFAFPANRDYFGTVSHDVQSIGGQVFALYEGLLERAPDVLGAEAFAAQLKAGASLHDVTQAFLNSAEGQTHLNAGTNDNAGFVEQLYETVLGRQGDVGGTNGWISQLNAGVSRADVADGFVFSAENVAQFQSSLDKGVFVADAAASAVAHLYYGLLDRAPDAGGLQSFTGQVHNGVSLTSVAQTFLTSTEYAQLHPGAQTDQQYVDSLYSNALGRTADAGGEQGWLNALSHGSTRADVAIGIAESQEANLHLVAKVEAGWHLA